MRAPEDTCYTLVTERRPAEYWLDYVCGGEVGDSPWSYADANGRCIGFNTTAGSGEDDPWLLDCLAVDERCCQIGGEVVLCEG